MVTFDDVIPVIITGAFMVLVVVIGKASGWFSQTSKSSVVATYSIGSLQGDLDDLKKQMRQTREHTDSSHDNIIALIEKRDEKLNDRIQQFVQKLDDVNIRSQLNTSKIESIERKIERYRNGDRGQI